MNRLQFIFVFILLQLVFGLNLVVLAEPKQASDAEFNTEIQSALKNISVCNAQLWSALENKDENGLSKSKYQQGMDLSYSYGYNNLYVNMEYEYRRHNKTYPFYFSKQAPELLKNINPEIKKLGNIKNEDIFKTINPGQVYYSIKDNKVTRTVNGHYNIEEKKSCVDTDSCLPNDVYFTLPNNDNPICVHAYHMFSQSFRWFNSGTLAYLDRLETNEPNKYDPKPKKQACEKSKKINQEEVSDPKELAAVVLQSQYRIFEALELKLNKEKNDEVKKRTRYFLDNNAFACKELTKSKLLAEPRLKAFLEKDQKENPTKLGTINPQQNNNPATSPSDKKSGQK